MLIMPCHFFSPSATEPCQPGGDPFVFQHTESQLGCSSGCYAVHDPVLGSQSRRTWRCQRSRDKTQLNVHLSGPGSHVSNVKLNSRRRNSAQSRRWWSWRLCCQKQTTLSLCTRSMTRIRVTPSLLLPPHVRHTLSFFSFIHFNIIV